MPVHRVQEADLDRRVRELEASGETVVTMTRAVLSPDVFVVLTSSGTATREVS